jgi:hypothetical protein
VAINSVAGPGVHLAAAARSIAPTVIVASAETAEALHADTKLGVAGGLKAIAHSAQTSALDNGYMPGETLFTKLNAPHRAAVGTIPGKLRLLLVSERAGAETPPLSSHDLSDLRIFTGARVLYALTAAPVAGAVAQSSAFDYRRQAGKKHAHFGPPLSSVEVKLVDSGSHRTSDEGARGEVCITSCLSSVFGKTLTSVDRLLFRGRQLRVERRGWVLRGGLTMMLRWLMCRTTSVRSGKGGWWLVCRE